MSFRKIQLPDLDDFLACTVATTVLRPDVRQLREIAKKINIHGYNWILENSDPQKDEQWWSIVEGIENNFLWDRFLNEDTITAKVHQGSLEFGSIGSQGGGCHRSIALAVGVLAKKIIYQPFDILLYCS